MNKNIFRSLFSPSSVAVLGATSDPDKIGFRISKVLLKQKFPGKIYFINSKGGMILNRSALTDIDQLPKGIDLAILAIPKKGIYTAVESCIKRKIRFAVVLTAGFKEIGKEGVSFEKDLRTLLDQSSTRLIGPNCAGLCNTWADLHAAIEIYPPRGKISFVSQSGSLCSTFSSHLSARGTGVSKYISLGNKVDVSEADLIDFFAQDKETRCIALYLEDIVDGRRLMKTARRVSKHKPMVVLKSGHTPEGSRATFSHTGAMAGDDTLADGAFRQMGMIRVNELTDLYNVSAALNAIGPLAGNRTAIISDAGGPGVIAADAAVTAGLKLPRLHPKTQKEIRAFLPNFASVQNPIDMTFTRDIGLYFRCIEALQHEGMNAVMITIPSHFSIKEEIVSVLTEAKEKLNIPLFIAWLCADDVEEQRRQLWQAGIPAFIDPRQAAFCISRLAWYGNWLRRRAG